MIICPAAVVFCERIPKRLIFGKVTNSDKGGESVRASETAAAPGAVARTDPAPAPAARQNFRSTDWTRALLRSDTITLPGFSGPVVEAAGIPWMRIGADDVSPQAPSAAATRIRLRTVAALGVAGMVAMFVIGAVGQAWHSNSTARQQRVAALPAWSVTKIDGEGLTIMVDGNGAKTIRVQLGGTLPNGERLVETDPARHIYRTPGTSVLVRQAADQTPHTP